MPNNNFLWYVPAGVLLLDQSVHYCRSGRERGQIRDDRNRRDHGEHDSGGHAADGQNRPEDVTPLWSGWNVYIFNIHNNIVVDHGKLSHEC